MEPDKYEPDYEGMQKHITSDGHIAMRHATEPPDADWIRVPVGTDIEVKCHGNRRVFYINTYNLGLRDRERLLDTIKEHLRQKRKEEGGITLELEAKDCEPQCREDDCLDEAMPPESGVHFLSDRPPVKMDILYDYIHASDEESERILARYKRWRMEMLKIEIMAKNPEMITAEENAWKDS